MPKGYVIITEDIKDPAGMAEYGKLASQTMAGATVLSFGPKPETLEGEWHGTQTVLLEFESVEAARSGTTPTRTRRPRSCARPRPTATGSSSPASERCVRAPSSALDRVRCRCRPALRECYRGE